MLKSISDYRNELSQLLDTIEKDPNAKDRNYGPEVRIMASNLQRVSEKLMAEVIMNVDNLRTATLSAAYVAADAAHKEFAMNGAVYLRVIALIDSGLI